MAKIEIPKFSNPPRTDDINVLITYIKQLANQTALLSKALDFVVNDGNIDAENIRAKTITAGLINVDELSAISANIGEVTAGIIRGIQIYGSKIATQETGYPRSEMDVASNLFAAYQDANRYVMVTPEYSGSPSVYFKAPANQLILSCADTMSNIDSEDRLFITSTQDIVMDQGSGSNVIFQSTSAPYFTSEGQTLQEILSTLYGLISDLDSRVTALGG